MRSSFRLVALLLIAAVLVFALAPAVKASPAKALLILDNNPWASTANQQVLTALGIPYDQKTSGEIGALDLSPYTMIIIPSAQSDAYYNLLGGWLASGGKIEAWISKGGVLVFHGADYGWDGSGGWTGEWALPGGVQGDHYESASVSPGGKLWAFLKFPPLAGKYKAITDADIDGYWSTTHGHFTNIPSKTAVTVIDDATGEPCYIVYKYGGGRVLATMLTLEWMGWISNPGANAMYALYNDLYSAWMWAGG